MEHSASEIYEMHAVIQGQVQGVGFRAMTRYYANGLGITGTVKNLKEGGVEIYAHGPKKKLDDLLKKLQEEAFPEHISESSIDFFPIEKPHEDFKIIH